MSDLAICETGEQKAASEFHDDYILYKVKHDTFVCPFCCIELVPKAIYIDGPQGKSPHFSCFPRKPHVLGCDGHPLVDGKTTKDSKKTNKLRIGKEEFSFPEKLVPRRKSTSKSFVEELKDIVNKNDPRKVRARRDMAGREVGVARYTSVIIRSFASAKKNIISLVYQYARDENLSDEERKILLKSSLSQAPIELEGHRANYQTAFRGTKYYSKYKKIWDGKGNVLANERAIVVHSNQPMEYKDDSGDYILDFYVKIATPENPSELPAYHQTTVKRLLAARQNEVPVRWSGYGLALPALGQSAVVLQLENLDHLFIEKV